MYLLSTQKIYKDGFPLWPIVDYAESVVYYTSVSINFGKLNIMYNSKQLADLIGDGERFVSHDAVWLFTNIAITSALPAIEEELEREEV